MKVPMLHLQMTTQFKKDLRRMAKRGADVKLLDEVVSMLLRQEILPAKFKDHPLTGNWVGYRDCHIEPDWILLYKVEKDSLVLLATRTGTHSDLFRE